MKINNKKTNWKRKLVFIFIQVTTKSVLSISLTKMNISLAQNQNRSDLVFLHYRKKWKLFKTYIYFKSIL